MLGALQLGTIHQREQVVAQMQDVICKVRINITDQLQLIRERGWQLTVAITVTLITRGVLLLIIIQARVLRQHALDVTMGRLR
jgi:hypothetical protein